MKNRSGLQNMIEQGRAEVGPLWGRTECCNRSGAERIKDKIVTYWRERGYEVNVTLRECEFTSVMRSKRFDIRSDLVNGLPKDYGAK